MKRIVFIIVILAAIFASAGCGGTGDIGGDNGGSTGDPLIYIVDLCYINNEYVETGDEELPMVFYYRNQHMYAPEGRQYLALLDETLREIVIGSESVGTMITDKVQFNSVEVKDGTAYVDIAGENLSGSSLEEGLLISQIVYSLTGSFEEIESVQFLIDGEVTETLMGHYDTEKPYETGIYPI